MEKRIREKLSGCTVGIAGLGGLGSSIAVLLARSGVGRLILADFDVVDESNIYRQQYIKRQIGMKKTDAIRQIIGWVDDEVKVKTFDERLDGMRACEIFEEADIVIEAFDNPKSKADIVGAVLKNTCKKVVSASGIAGHGPGDEIVSKKVLSNLYVVGDGGRGIVEGEKLMATRVAIAASKQAHLAVRIMIGEEE